MGKEEEQNLSNEELLDETITGPDFRLNDKGLKTLKEEGSVVTTIDGVQTYFQLTGGWFVCHRAGDKIEVHPRSSVRVKSILKKLNDHDQPGSSGDEE